MRYSLKAGPENLPTVFARKHANSWGCLVLCKLHSLNSVERSAGMDLQCAYTNKTSLNRQLYHTTKKAKIEGVFHALIINIMIYI